MTSLFLNIQAKLRSFTRFVLLLLLFLNACVQQPVTPLPDPGQNPEPQKEVIPIIDGYTEKLSYTKDETLALFLNAEKTSDNAIIHLYDIQGNIIDSVPYQAKPQIPIGDSPWSNGFEYEPSLEYDLTKLNSGLYLWANKIPFVLKDLNNQAPIRVLWPSNTINAYICSGGKNLYSCGIADKSERPNKLSFQRPLMIRSEYYRESTPILTDWQGHGLPFLRWLESNKTQLGTNYSVITDADLDDLNSLSGSKLLIIAGHSEYWTREARLNLDAFIENGGNVAILSGNTSWWQVRYSEDKTQMIGYKSSVLDPIADPLLKTDLWRTPGLNYPILNSFGADFELGGYGNTAVLETMPEEVPEGWNGYKIVNPASPLLENTGLVMNDIIHFDFDRFHEYDGSPILGVDDNGHPVLDKQSLGFHQLELIGFDHGYRNGPTVGTFIAFQKTEGSGIVINTATNIWTRALEGSSQAFVIQQITFNIINKLLQEKPIFVEAETKP